MTAQPNANAVMFWVSLLLLWALVYFFYRDYRVDYFRQRLFDLRAELFDLALAGKVAFDNPAYTRLRMQMNGFIRHADRLNVPFVFLLSFAFRREARGYDIEHEWSSAVDLLDPGVRDKITELRTSMHAELGKQILMASPLCLLTGIPLVLLAAMHLITGQILRATVRHCYSIIGPTFRRLILNPLDVAALNFSDDVGLAGMTGEHRAMLNKV